MTFGLCKAGGGGGGGGDFQEKKGGGRRRKFPAPTFMGNATASVPKRKVLFFGVYVSIGCTQRGQKPFISPLFKSVDLPRFPPSLADLFDLTLSHCFLNRGDCSTLFSNVKKYHVVLSAQSR